MALEFSTSRPSSCSPSSSSRTFYGVFSLFTALLIGDSVENLEWIKQTSKMKCEAGRFKMRGTSVFSFGRVMLRRLVADGLQMQSMAACCWKYGVCNSERFVCLSASRSGSDGDCASSCRCKDQPMFSRQAGCGSGCDGVVSVRGKSSNFGRGSTDVDNPLLVFPFDCNLMFICPVDVP